MGRVGGMEELENLAVFLISGGCDWITGETIAMDGAQALATGGNFYEMREWSDADWQQARDAIADAEREGPRGTGLASLPVIARDGATQQSSLRCRRARKLIASLRIA